MVTGKGGCYHPAMCQTLQNARHLATGCMPSKSIYVVAYCIYHDHKHYPGCSIMNVLVNYTIQTITMLFRMQQVDDNRRFN